MARLYYVIIVVPCLALHDYLVYLEKYSQRKNPKNRQNYQKRNTIKKNALQLSLIGAYRRLGRRQGLKIMQTALPVP